MKSPFYFYNLGDLSAKVFHPLNAGFKITGQKGKKRCQNDFFGCNFKLVNKRLNNLTKMEKSLNK